MVKFRRKSNEFSPPLLRPAGRLHLATNMPLTQHRQKLLLTSRGGWVVPQVYHFVGVILQVK